MRVFIVHAHAEPKSFNGAMTSTAMEALTTAGHDVVLSDLYAIGFNPVSDRSNFVTVHNPDYYRQQSEEAHAAAHNGFAPDIQAEIDKLFWGDAPILQFPLWWFGLPAILKGWIDRVFASGGRTYGGGKWYDRGVFAGKRAMCSVTIGGPSPIYSEHGLDGPISSILFPINHGVLYFTGFTVIDPFLVHAPARISEAERAAHLDRYRKHVLTLATAPTITYRGLADYDERFVLKLPPCAWSGPAIRRLEWPRPECSSSRLDEAHRASSRRPGDATGVRQRLKCFVPGHGDIVTREASARKSLYPTAGNRAKGAKARDHSSPSATASNSARFCRATEASMRALIRRSMRSTPLSSPSNTACSRDMPRRAANCDMRPSNRPPRRRDRVQARSARSRRPARPAPAARSAPCRSPHNRPPRRARSRRCGSTDRRARDNRDRPGQNESRPCPGAPHGACRQARAARWSARRRHRRARGSRWCGRP